MIIQLFIRLLVSSLIYVRHANNTSLHIVIILSVLFIHRTATLIYALQISLNTFVDNYICFAHFLFSNMLIFLLHLVTLNLKEFE